MAGAAGPQAGEAVVDATTLVVDQPAAFGGDDQARVALEVAVRGKRHPVGVQLELAGEGKLGGLRHVHEWPRKCLVLRNDALLAADIATGIKSRKSNFYNL
ncbi:hypothetical protein D9M69_680890 [compost metagenome]